MSSFRRASALVSTSTQSQFRADLSSHRDRRPLASPVPSGAPLPRVVMASERIILEEFVEGITLLPNEIRRNFELMKSLDRSSSIVLCELSECEKRALQRAKRKLRESSGALAQPGADRRR